MYKRTLNSRSIQLQLSAKNRNEAIQKAAQPLVECGKITPGYISQMIDAVDHLGPYMVLAPGIALVHSRPSDDVLEDCMSLLTLSHPVAFGHPQHDPVHTIFVVAAKHPGHHVQALQEIACLLINTDLMDTLSSINDTHGLMKYFDTPLAAVGE